MTGQVVLTGRYPATARRRRVRPLRSVRAADLPRPGGVEPRRVRRTALRRVRTEAAGLLGVRWGGRGRGNRGRRRLQQRRVPDPRLPHGRVRPLRRRRPRAVRPLRRAGGGGGDRGRKPVRRVRGGGGV